MMSVRRGVVVAIAAMIGVVIGGWIRPATAQDVAEICVAGKVVARVRATGPYGSLWERERKINQAIVEVQSTEDCNHPKIWISRNGDTVNIWAWKHKLLTVYPEDAAPYRMTPKALAVQWKANFAKRLPEAVPVSKMTPDNPAWPYGKLGQPKPSEAAPAPEKPIRVEVASPSAKPSVQKPNRPSIARPSVPAEAAREAVIVAFEKARWLSDEGYLMQQKELAEDLLAELQDILSPTPSHRKASPGTGDVSTTSAAPEPVMVTEAAVPGEEGETSPPAEPQQAPQPPALTRGEAIAKVLVTFEQVRRLTDAQYLLQASAEANALIDSLRPYLDTPVLALKPGEIGTSPQTFQPTSATESVNKIAVKERIARLRGPYMSAKRAGKDVSEVETLIKEARDAWYAGEFVRANELAALAEIDLGVAQQGTLEPIEKLPGEAQPVTAPPTVEISTESPAGQPAEEATSAAPAAEQPAAPVGMAPAPTVVPNKMIIKDKIASTQAKCNQAQAEGHDVAAIKRLLKNARAAWYRNDFAASNSLVEEAIATLQKLTAAQ